MSNPLQVYINEIDKLRAELLSAQQERDIAINDRNRAFAENKEAVAKAVQDEREAIIEFVTRWRDAARTAHEEVDNGTARGLHGMAEALLGYIRARVTVSGTAAPGGRDLGGGTITFTGEPRCPKHASPCAFDAMDQTPTCVWCGYSDCEEDEQ